MSAGYFSKRIPSAQNSGIKRVTKKSQCNILFAKQNAGQRGNNSAFL
jgi:hypothetical protein